MAPARTRRRSSGAGAAADGGGGGAGPSSVSATMTTPISAGKLVSGRAAATGGRRGRAAASVSVRADATVGVVVGGGGVSGSAPAVTPAPFAPVGGRSFPEHETTIDDLPEELLLKVR